MRAGTSPSFWKQCGVPARTKTNCEWRSSADLSVELEAEAPFEDVPRLALVGVGMEGRPVSGRYDVLESR